MLFSLMVAGVLTIGPCGDPPQDYGDHDPPPFPIGCLPPSIAQFEWLRKLSISYTDVSDLSPIAGQDELLELDLSQTKVTDLSALEELRPLQKLDLSGPPVTDLSGLKGAKAITLAALHGNPFGNPFDDLTPLEGMPVLSTLWIGVRDLAPLAKVPLLTDIGIDCRPPGETPHDDWNFAPLKGLGIRVGRWNSLPWSMFWGRRVETRPNTVKAVVCTTVRSEKLDCICRTPGSRAR